MRIFLSASAEGSSSSGKMVGPYRLLKWRGSNDMLESWTAWDTAKSRNCFIKFTHDKATIGDTQVQEIINRSFTLQRTLTFHKLVTARKKSTFDDTHCLEYPYFDKQHWNALKPNELWMHYSDLLPQMFQQIDYLHLMGMVHCDLKIENFLVKLNGKKPQVRLSDFDFLTESGSEPSGLEWGPNDLLPPEMKIGQQLFPESDIFTFGKSLQLSLEKFVATAGNQKKVPSADLNRLQEIIASLCTEDRYRRPSVLLAISPPGFAHNSPILERLRRELLVAYLHTRMQAAPDVSLKSERKLSRYLRSKCNLFGIPDDITGQLLSLDKTNRRTAWRTCVTLAQDQRSKIGQHGNMFQITLDKEAIRTTLSENGASAADISAPDAFVSGVLAKTEKYRKAGHFWRGLFACESALRTAEKNPKVDKITHVAPLIRQLGEFSQRLYLHQDAARYFLSLVEMPSLPLPDLLDAAREYAMTLIRFGKLDEAETFLRKQLDDAGKKQGDELLRLRLRQLIAWILLSARKSEAAEKELADILTTARQQQFHGMTISALYSLGVLRWRQGNFKDSVNYLEEGIALAREYDLPLDIMSSLTTLSLLYCELGAYTKGLRLCKQFLRNMDPAKHFGFLPSIYQTISFAYTRLAKYAKANYWLQKYLEAGSADPTARHLLLHAHNQTFLKMNAGDLSTAREWANQTLQTDHLTGTENFLGKTYHCLAEMELMNGRREGCERYAKQAMLLFTESGRRTAEAEIELIRLAAEALYESRQLDEHMERQRAILHDLNCTYYESLALFYQYVLPSGEISESLNDTTKDFLAEHEEANVPLFSALKALSSIPIKPGAGQLDRQIEAHKQAFLLLNQSSQRFLALLTTLRLVDLLRKANMFRQASRYGKLAKDLALQLDNEPLIQEAETQLRTLPPLTTQSGDLISIFHSISELVKSVSDYHQTLDSLLRFAVNQSGAERGVLFLTTADGSGLRAITGVRCDELSIADAADFSRSVVDKAVEEMEPLVVENARTDPRTNKYRSIVRYNILSVIALPLTHGDQVIGVLYLDHHAIPSVFSDDDIRLVQTIANFIAQTIETAEGIRRVRLQRDQFAEEAGRKTRRRGFICANPVMTKLLREIPPVAKSDIPILLTGESGTGKELIAEEIHRLSNRSDKQMVRFNSAALTSTMAEAELFGIAKGTATGVAGRDGLLAHADGSTLFFDEIGDMKMEIQAKLLRAIEQQQFNQVGSTKIIRTDIRFIFATNQDLRKLIEKGEFRKDLYYRVAKYQVEIPPLRNRPEDIPLLLDYFLEVYGKDAPPRFTVEARLLLQRHTWPGNVRELQAFVELLCIQHPRETIGADMIPQEIREIASKNYDQHAAETAEAARFKELFRRLRGNQSEMARQLGMSLSTLRRRLKKYDIK